MTRALPRTNFNSSELSRLLAGLGLVDAAAPGSSFAERLGEWLNAADATRLYAAHNAGAADAPGALPNGPAALREEGARLRAALAEGIARSCTPSERGGRIRLPLPDPASPPEIAAAYEPYRRFYLAQQREMEAAVGSLRARARAALARAAPGLAKLASLDAALDRILSDREGRLLATVPALLEKRFGALRDARPADQADDAAAWLRPGGWLADFCGVLRAALLAELDLRLQPALGLIEAFCNEETRRQ